MVFAVGALVAVINVAYLVGWAAFGFHIWKLTAKRPFVRAASIAAVLFFGLLGASIVRMLASGFGRALVH
jgi:hypothetical protein